MAIQTTLADLRQRCKDRFDAGQSAYIDDAQWNRLINEAGAHLHNWIVTTGEDYIWKTFPITIIPNQMDYPLPGDFFKDLKVFGVTANPSGPASYMPMRRLMKEEFRGGYSTFNRAALLSPFGYMILGQTLRITPVPVQSNFSVEMWYTPHYRQLQLDSDVMDASVAPGWDEYVVNQVVINARLKEEGDIRDLLVEQQRIQKMIEEDIMNRDMGKPMHVSDATVYAWPYGPWGLSGWSY